MKISSAIFEGSAPSLESCPAETLPEFALIGRSNVGKSSLLHLLVAGKKDLARTSGKPGSTVLINFFEINRQWRLVDLPGYGYARSKGADRARFSEAIGDYLQHRTVLRRVLVLIDARIPPQAIDLDLIGWLVANEVPYILTFTKSEKVKAGKLDALRKTFADHVSQCGGEPPESVAVSATKGLGRRELLGMIGAALKG